MPLATRPRRSPTIAAVLTIAVLVAAALVTGPASAHPAPLDRDPVALGSPAVGRAPLFDVREGTATTPGPRASRALGSLAAGLGALGVVDVEETTGRPRVITRLDGFLTGPSEAAPEEVALAFVDEHRDAFELDEDDLAGLELVRDYVDLLGTHHLTWIQHVDGVPVWDADLRAHVTADGELVAVTGSPVPDLDVPNLRPAVTAKGAIAASYADAGAGTPALGTPARTTGGARSVVRFAGGDDARLVVFPTPRGARLAWRTTAFVDDDEVLVTIVDAAGGEVLWTTNLVRADGTGLAWESWPGTTGTPQAPVTFPVRDGSALRGPNAWVFPDVDDDDRPDEQIAASSGLDWSYAAALDTTDAANGCSDAYPCSWDAGTPFSWRANLEQNATQVYHLLNRFHDHLEAAPIGFTEAAGNFEGKDAVVAHVFDGAGTGAQGGLPDQRHRANANMATLPDGRAPRMQMYLFPPMPGLGVPASNGGDDASIVYHEYAHGLSSRLVTYADGTSALNAAQSGAMAEAWSDFYAMDLLVTSGAVSDGPGADVSLAPYVSGGRTDYIRTEPLDCEVGGPCPGGLRTGAGGYTYGDFGRVYGVPEVHGDGEIWGQTLWDLRDALGSDATLMLVTRAMELSPVEPSFLDMRNAIVEADRIAFGGANAATIWDVFATRGMGFFAVAIDGSDTSPVEDLSTPPVCPGDCGTLRGVVVDSETGERVGRARVELAGHASGFGSDLAARLSRRGRFAIADVPFHRYVVTIEARGYEDFSKRVRVDGQERLRLRLRRDWAALDGGARLVRATRPDYSAFGCGPERAFDGSIATGWGSDAPANGDTGVAGPREAIVRLAEDVDVSSFGFATGGTCGDGPSAAVRSFSIYTRTGRGPWELAFQNTGQLERYVMHTLRPRRSAASGVEAVRVVMRSSAGDPRFMDMLELSVRGVPSR